MQWDRWVWWDRRKTAMRVLSPLALLYAGQVGLFTRLRICPTGTHRSLNMVGRGTPRYRAVVPPVLSIPLGL